MDLNTTTHGRTLKDYQTEAVSLVNLAMSGKEVYAKQRIAEVLKEVWCRPDSRWAQKATKLTKG